MRAREKEIVKRRLAALAEREPRRRGADRRQRPPASTASPASRAASIALDALLNAQSYRLAHWRVASEEINYRRFFDVNELAALRMEDPAVFDEVHRFAFELVRRGAVTGLRIDHVDGLFAPGDYLRRLQERLLPRSADGDGRSSSSSKRSSAPASSSPSDWPVHGTTGYEFARDRQQPVRRPPATSARSTTSTAASSRERAAVVRRSRLPRQEAGAARDDVGRHQLARPPAQSLLRAQPPLPRLHALQPDLDAEGSDRLLPGLPDLRHRRPSRSASTTAATSSRRCSRREAAGAGGQPAGVRLHRAAAAQADARRRRRRSARSGRGSSASSSRSPARSPPRASRTRRSTSTTGCCR